MSADHLPQDSKFNFPTNQIPPKPPDIYTSNSSLTISSFKDKLLSKEVEESNLESIHINSPMPRPQALIVQTVRNPNCHNTPNEDNSESQVELTTSEQMALDSPSSLDLQN